MRKRPRSPIYNNNYTAVECGMNNQTMERPNQTRFTEEMLMKELFVSKARGEDAQYPQCWKR